MLDETKLETLKEWGVKDSKKLSPRRRSYLYQKLKTLSDDCAIIKLTAMDIDRLRTTTNLNKIEIKHMQDLVNALKPDKIIIDSIEANTKKFREMILHGLNAELKERIKEGMCELICENFADANYPIVGAASIMAKVIRDAEVRKLQKEFAKYGDFNSGYCSDPKTIAFLKTWLEKNKELPHFVRRSWITSKELLRQHHEKHVQRKMGEFTK